jgi:hypothetical protein
MMEFINFCDAKKILLAVFPPHATHSLQPLDVVLFAPLSSSYSQELEHFIHQSQGLLTIKKGDFFPLFWAAWTSSFKVETIRKRFEATGIFPMNADIILQRFTNHTSNGASDFSLESEGDNSTWRDLRKNMLLLCQIWRQSCQRSSSAHCILCRCKMSSSTMKSGPTHLSTRQKNAQEQGQDS